MLIPRGDVGAALGAESLCDEILCSTYFVALDDIDWTLARETLQVTRLAAERNARRTKSLDGACDVAAGGKSVVSGAMLGKLHGGQIEREYSITAGGSRRSWRRRPCAMARVLQHSTTSQRTRRSAAHQPTATNLMTGYN